MSPKAHTAEKLVASNRKAGHFMEIFERIEVGIELKGAEVKALRAGHVEIKDAYADVDGGELYLHKLVINPYQGGMVFAPEPGRRRRLLIHRLELDRLAGKMAQKGATLVPLKLYFNANGWAKVELGLAKGIRKGDRREVVKKKEAEREMRRVRGV